MKLQELADRMFFEDSSSQFRQLIGMVYGPSGQEALMNKFNVRFNQLSQKKGDLSQEDIHGMVVELISPAVGRFGQVSVYKAIDQIYPNDNKSIRTLLSAYRCRE